MNIEKTIVLDHEIEALQDLRCHEKISTTALSNGLECSGILEISGKGKIHDSFVPIHEMIDLSIFAPFSKLSETEQFEVKLTDYSIQAVNNELKCIFTFEVKGIVDQDEFAKENEEASVEDLLDDSDVVSQKVRYVLTYQSDTYLSIAKRYGVDEKAVRALNHNKTLTGRMLILIP